MKFDRESGAEIGKALSGCLTMALHLAAIAFMVAATLKMLGLIPF